MLFRDSGNRYSLHYGLIFHLLSTGSGSLHQPLPCRWEYHTTRSFDLRLNSAWRWPHQCSRGVRARLRGGRQLYMVLRTILAI